MKPHRLLILLGALTGLTAVAQTNLASLFSNVQDAANATPRRPSIIIIQCHDLAYGDLSCNGQTNYSTPNLDRLAAEGVRFTNYTGGADSAATTAMLLAGQPDATGLSATNLAQVLHRQGYRTGFIGEWTFDQEPWRHGFDQFAGFFSDDEARNYFAPEIWRYPRPMYDESNRVTSVSLFHETLYRNADGKKGQYLPDLLVMAMNNFIRIATPDAANRWRPFFLVVNLPAPRSTDAQRDVFPVPSDAPYTGEPWPQAAKDRAALITRVDGGIGRLFEQLGKSKLTNNAVVFFTSSAAPEKFADTNLDFLLPRNDFRGTNNPAPRLPLLVRYPAKIPAGQVRGLKANTADIAPTALEMGHAKPEKSFTGTSLLPFLHGGQGTNGTGRAF